MGLGALIPHDLHLLPKESAKRISLVKILACMLWLPVYIRVNP